MSISPSGEHGRHIVGCARSSGFRVLSYGQWRVRKAFERRQSLDRPVDPHLQSRRRRRKSTRGAEYRESESARDLARCTGVGALGVLSSMGCPPPSPIRCRPTDPVTSRRRRGVSAVCSVMKPSMIVRRFVLVSDLGEL